jgi:hypothetical protein
VRQSAGGSLRLSISGNHPFFFSVCSAHESGHGLDGDKTAPARLIRPDWLLNRLPLEMPSCLHNSLICIILQSDFPKAHSIRFIHLLVSAKVEINQGQYLLTGVFGMLAFFLSKQTKI